jgi:hypothetical protein
MNIALPQFSKSATIMDFLQYRHYQALLDVFSLRPSKEAKEFGELATFVAQVDEGIVGCACLPCSSVEHQPSNVM